MLTALPEFKIQSFNNSRESKLLEEKMVKCRKIVDGKDKQMNKEVKTFITYSEKNQQFDKISFAIFAVAPG